MPNQRNGRTESVARRGKPSRRIAIAASKSGVADQPDDVDYWLKEDPAERVAAVEVMRQRLYGG